jgi:hypothetical protein
MPNLRDLEKIRRDLMKARRKELLDKGWNPNTVDIALEWAIGSARGMAGYYIRESGENENGAKETLVNTMLPRYLLDCEKWMLAFNPPPVQKK